MLSTPTLAMHKTKAIQVYPNPTPHRSQAKLILFENGHAVKLIHLPQKPFSMGFDEENHLVLKDPYVSNQHCQIIYENGFYFLQDLKSTNGTFLNQAQIQKSILFHKSHIRLGKTLLQFQTAEPKTLTKQNNFCGIISKNMLMQHVFDHVEKIANQDITVTIYGKTGTGKELIAKAIHQKSDRKNHAMVVVNCGAIPKELIESELFGHLRGSFTGATGKKVGSFELADGGTLFLDEVGELPLDLQPKLLRAIEYGEIKPVGATLPIKVNARIVAATHRNLAMQVEQNLFREDLYYRLHIVPLYLPDLKERKEDIPLLVEHFLGRHPITHKAIQLLLRYDWPGNIRELKNILERLRVTRDQTMITESDVQRALNTCEPKPFSDLIKNFERDMIQDFLDRNHWNKSKTARALSIPKTTLMDKIKRFGLQPSANT